MIIPLLQRERRRRGPYAMLFNLPENERTGEDQRYNDWINVKAILDEIMDEEVDGITLDDKVLGVVRIGRKVDGKHRPIRVKFRDEFYRNAAVKYSFRIRYLRINENCEIFRNAIMCRDLCREDRERSKRKYEERKQQRERELERISVRPEAEGGQVPPPNQNGSSQGAEEGNATPPRLEDQHGAP